MARTYSPSIHVANDELRINRHYVQKMRCREEANSSYLSCLEGRATTDNTTDVGSATGISGCAR